MIQTSLCYIIKDGRYLLLHRVKSKKQEMGDPNAGKWIGIGGKFEVGETPEQCNIREVWEETGLTLTDYTYRGVVDFISDLWENEQMHLFTASGFEGRLKDCEEGELAWINEDDVLSLPMWEGDRIFLEKIKQETPFFHLTLQYEGDSLVHAEMDGAVIK